MLKPLYHVFLILLVTYLTIVATISYAMPLAEPRISNEARKSAILVQFANNPALNLRLQDAVAQARQDTPNLQILTLQSENELAATLDNISFSSVGMVVLIAPQYPEAVAALPGMYPDLSFTFIDLGQSFFASNVQTVEYKEEEGAFLLGAIASLRGSQKMSLAAMEKTMRNDKIMEGFSNGARAMNSAIVFDMRYPIHEKVLQESRISGVVGDMFRAGSDVIFSTDTEICEQALRDAKAERKYVVCIDEPNSAADTNRLLTYSVKRYDLALLDVVRIFRHNQWRAGTISLGVSGGYIDYALDQDNIDLFPKDSLDKIEGIKDYISQGLLLRKPQ